MKHQLSILDAIAAREQGLDRAEHGNKSFVETMRQVAVEHATKHGTVTSDDLRRYANEHGLEPGSSNVWGALFRGKRFKCVGRKRSTLASNHAREIRIWALA